MRLIEFRVTHYRNIIDSGWVNVQRVTAVVGQNEGGKSNLCEALYRVNPFEGGAKYNIDEDWPADDWGGRDRTATVCQCRFEISEKDEISDLFQAALIPEKVNETEGSGESQSPPEVPTVFNLSANRKYEGDATIIATAPTGFSFDPIKLARWVMERMPKFVYIREYDLSGSQIELDYLAQRQGSVQWSQLTNEEQTILIVLKLAAINIQDFLSKGSSPQGRTLRSFDKRQASAYLTKQFARLWKQKDVRFDIDIDNTTLNIFVEDLGLGMPVRLSKRSTGFRWYVSFAWKFTHASQGEYKNCVLLLEEPGIHLHHAGHRDLLELFEELAGTSGTNKVGGDNTIIYTTHLATMLDESYPERVRIVEVQNHHSQVVNGMVSSQRRPMMVIESRLGLAGGMSGLLGNRQTLIVEGGDDAIILQTVRCAEPKRSTRLVRANLSISGRWRSEDTNVRRFFGRTSMGCCSVTGLG
jgi:energy-coupling factor transporter ATP-binding protein EcfA2